MNLYLLTQDEIRGYDTFDRCVVAAPDEEAAKTLSPSNGSNCSDWPASEYVKAHYLGEAKVGTKQRIILASYKAG